ncbi:hypothetical protein PXK01_00810 [Phaeobacter sp. PT47_59]|uniref:hypothetical protein n=1 Tax=Phaeobacter sp. PT47_59 TaxID=3029979 RepID=UPI0023809CCC|nr:hypothetical protein [Phaeobacter sp. PT47_59]MDE4172670.1 hypothetical protein [Phaeobacter sp. PT47_59]
MTQANAAISQASNPLTGSTHALRAIPAVAADKVVRFIRWGQPRKTEIDAVFDRYDLTDISPREIDALTAELSAAGYRDASFLRMLSRRGAAALAQSRQGFAKIGYQVSMFDAEERLDLRQVSREQVKLAEFFGEPTQELEAFMAEVERLEFGRQPAAPVPPAPRAAQDILVLTQARRV